VKHVYNTFVSKSSHIAHMFQGFFVYVNLVSKY